jgi:hypothetical protein
MQESWPIAHSSSGLEDVVWRTCRNEDLEAESLRMWRGWHGLCRSAPNIHSLSLVTIPSSCRCLSAEAAVPWGHHNPSPDDHHGIQERARATYQPARRTNFTNPSRSSAKRGVDWRRIIMRGCYCNAGPRRARSTALPNDGLLTSDRLSSTRNRFRAE